MKVKGVIHMHSTHSYDGKMPLSELKNFLKEKGMHFACMTEHTDKLTKETANKFVAECHELSDESFVFVPGFEVPYKTAHVLHIGSTDFVCYFANADQLREWRMVSPLVVLAHPVRNKFDVDDTLLECIDGVEIWNQQYEGKKMARPRSMKLLRKLRLQKPLLSFGGLDLHRSEHFGSPLTTLDVESLNEKDIVDSLKNGNFSFGNEELSVSSRDDWQPTSSQVATSRKSIIVIRSGKLVNKILFNLGLSLPKGLKQSVRSRV